MSIRDKGNTSRAAEPAQQEEARNALLGEWHLRSWNKLPKIMILLVSHYNTFMIRWRLWNAVIKWGLTRVHFIFTSSMENFVSIQNSLTHISSSAAVCLIVPRHVVSQMINYPATELWYCKEPNGT